MKTIIRKRLKGWPTGMLSAWLYMSRVMSPRSWKVWKESRTATKFIRLQESGDGWGYTSWSFGKRIGLSREDGKSHQTTCASHCWPWGTNLLAKTYWPKLTGQFQPPRLCGCTSGKIMFRETLSHWHPWRKMTNPSSFFTFCSYWCWQRMTEWLPTMGCQLCWPLCTPCRHDHRTLLLHAPPAPSVQTYHVQKR